MLDITLIVSDLFCVSEPHEVHIFTFVSVETSMFFLATFDWPVDPMWHVLDELPSPQNEERQKPPEQSQ
jgi:hypothetical protein